MKTKFITVYLSIVLALVCVVSGTLAFFTDTTSAKVNTVVSGTLDIELQYSLNDGLTWHDLHSDSQVLKYMPGGVHTVLLRISNKGNLALKYELSSVNLGTVLGRNDQGQDIDLSDYLMVASGDAASFADDAAFESAVRQLGKSREGSLSSHAIGDTVLTGVLEADQSKVVRLAVYMPASVGNEANYSVSNDPDNPNKYRPEIQLGLFLAATQAAVESDSIGNQYDQDAEVPKPQIP